MISTYTVAGMTCGHCASAVTRELARIPGVEQVDVDVATGSVRVDSAGPLDVLAVREAIEEAGYELQSAPGAGG